MPRTRSALVLLLAGLILFALHGTASAQTTSGIRGVVLDKDGQPLPSARVTVTNPSIGLTQNAVTDAKGEFRIAPLPPGKGYTLRVEFPSMGTIVQSDIELSANRMTSVPVTLRPDKELQERIRVTAQAEVVNTEQTTTQTSFSSEFIEALPILGRNYQDVLTLAPGVSDVDGDGNPNIHGARDTDVVTLVDGVSTTDPFSGQRGQELNIESIQEIEVKTAGASAEFSRAQGGFVNIVTKSGGNDFEGSFKFFWRSNIFDGDGAGLDDPALHGGLGELGLRDLSFNDYTPFLSLSGPIKRDKAWYFFTAEYIQEQNPVNASTQAFVRTVKERRVFGKASWDLSTNHKLVFSATIDPQEFFNLGINSLTLLESGFTFETGGLNLILKETAIFSPNLFLETTVQHFTSRPEFFPTLHPDTNGNGILFFDRNGNGFLEATERDPGEDFDRDGAFDIFEDRNKNGRLDKPDQCPGGGTICGEDLDGDGRLTIPGLGCEGASREDIDCDGNLDFRNEDLNGNGVRDPGEPDYDNDRRLDLGIEDRNFDRELNDRPFPSPGDDIFQFPSNNPQVPPFLDPVGTLASHYPYGSFRPMFPDRDYTFDQRTLRISGPFFQDGDAEVGRVTLRQDLTAFVADWHGQHEMKFGGIVEREHYNEVVTQRPILFPFASLPTGAQQILPVIAVDLPTATTVPNEATSTTFGFYAQDTYKPLPNLTLGIGVRFDREATDSFGFTTFDPVAERALYDRITSLAGTERISGDQYGNGDGIDNFGACNDPIFTHGPGVGDGCSSSANPSDADARERIAGLKRVAPSRLTQHHISTTLVADSLSAIFPEVRVCSINAQGEQECRIDLEALRERGAATFQQQEAFRLTNNNLAPRLSVAWDPWGDSKTKVFVNWGRFFDKLFLATVTGEEGPDIISRYYLRDADGLSSTGVPNNQVGKAVTKAPPTATQVDRGLQTPFSDELTLGFERELAPEVSIRFTYVNRKFRHGLQDKDINHSIRFGPTGGLLDQFGRLTGSPIPTEPAPDNRPDLYIHNFFFNEVFRLGNFNEARFKSLELQLIKRLSRKWQMEGSYVYSRAVGDAENFLSELGDDPATTDLEFGYLDFDQRHVVKLNLATYLPRDWQVGATLQWSSGLPYSVISTFSALDNFTYPQFRRIFGFTQRTAEANVASEGCALLEGNDAWEFCPMRRNSERNRSRYLINVSAEKAFVLGKFNSKLFLAVENLLNTDDLDIDTYEPQAANRSGDLQIVSEREFGRRFEVGFQFEF
jgi:hypothetical protein